VATSTSSAPWPSAKARASQYREGASRLHHIGAEHEPFAFRGRDEVGLELDRKHRGIGRHQREGSVAASAVERGGDDAGMHETMLLRKGEPIGHRELDLARLQARDLDAERLHRSLPGEARPHALVVVGVLGREPHQLSRWGKTNADHIFAVLLPEGPQARRCAARGQPPLTGVFASFAPQRASSPIA
jgi:hypothetical protein